MKKFLSKRFVSRLCVLVFLFIFVFSTFVFTSSAASVSNPDLVVNNFKVSALEVTLLSSKGDEVPVSVTVDNSKYGSDRMRLDISTVSGSNFWADYYNVMVYMIVENETYLNNSNFVDVSYDFCLPRSVGQGNSHSRFFRGNRLAFGAGGNTEPAKVSLRQDSSQNYFNFSFTNGEPGIPYNNYTSYFYFYFNDNTRNTFSIVLDNVDFKIVTPEEKAANSIKDNQDKNTDKLINGGHDSAAYENPDTSIYEDYKSKEDAINDKTHGSLDSSDNFLKTFFQEQWNYTTIWYGINGATRVMKPIFDNWFLKSIARFSLALGSFAFIIGSVSFVLSSYRSSENRKSAAEYRKSAMAYHKSAIDYYKSRRG